MATVDGSQIAQKATFKMSDIESHPDRPFPTLNYKSGSTVPTLATAFAHPPSTASSI
ncbi:hypothetical protein FRB90_009840, partial [Tulasnella sp. 427]